MTSNCLPSTVATRWYAFKSVDKTCSGSTWKVRMSASCALFSGFRSESTVPAGRAPNASLVGANTVNGPGDDNVSAKSAATTAVTRVERSSTDCANSTMLGLSAPTSGGGSMTPSMMWATPLLARLSAPVTFFRLLISAPTCTPLWVLMTSRCLPSTVATRWYTFKSVDKTCSGSTWEVRMSANCALFSGFRRESTVPAGRAPNASLVGANTVKGPGDDNVSAKSAATTAVTRVERSSTDSANDVCNSVAGKVVGTNHLLQALDVSAHVHTLLALDDIKVLAFHSCNSLVDLEVSG